MTHKKDVFSSMDSFVKSEIRLGDDNKVNVLGKGIIIVLSKQNEKRNIPNVYFVPNLKHNSMSVSPQNHNGYEVTSMVQHALSLTSHLVKGS